MVTETRTAISPGERAGWWPSRYGPDDEAGALNEITPAKVLDAVRLVRQGRVYDLAHVLHEDIPAFPGRTFRQYPTTNYHQINRRHPDAGPAGLGRNNVRHGVVIVENLRLEEVAREGVREFLLVISHAKLRGATGAWIAPLAIV